MQTAKDRPDISSDLDQPSLTSLDPVQTSQDFPESDKRGPSVIGEDSLSADVHDGPRHFFWQAASETESNFRHAPYQSIRTRVIAALVASCASRDRLWRYTHCGSECFVEVSEDGQKSRLVACYCEDRFCPACGLARGKKIFDELKVLCGRDPVRFLTLTRKADNASLQSALADLQRSFSRLRETDFWRSRVRGGAWFLEITRGARGAHWHVHLHVLVHGMFIDQRALSDHWHRCTRTSFIVHVRAVPGTDAGIRYCCKYVSKPLDPSVVKDPASLLEAVVTMKGKRMWGAFGTWFKRAETVAPGDQVKWRRVARLDAVIAAAAAREPWAVGLALMIGMRVETKQGRVIVSRARDAPAEEPDSTGATRRAPIP